MFDTTNVKNRIATTTNTVSDTAKSAVSTTYDKGYEVATGLPREVVEMFRNAFSKAMESALHYGEMTARAAKDGWAHYEDAYLHLQTAWNAAGTEASMSAAKDAVNAFFSGNFDLLMSNTLGVPLAKAFEAGVNLLTGTVTLGAVAEMAIPVIFIIGIGYASIKLREAALDKVSSVAEDVYDRVKNMDKNELADKFTSDDDEASTIEVVRTTSDGKDVHMDIDPEDFDGDIPETVLDAVDDATDDDNDDFDIVGAGFKEGSTDA